VDDLLSQPGNMPAMRAFVEGYLAGRDAGEVERFEVPSHPDESADEWADYDLPIATLTHGAAALAALHDIRCPGVEKVVSIPAELPPMEDVMPPDLASEWKRALRWRVTLTRVRSLRDFALSWFVLQLRRLERSLPSAQSQREAPAALSPAPATTVAPVPADTSHAPQEQTDDPNWQSVLAAVADESALAILNVAKDSARTADERMRVIYAIDNRTVGWTSGRWAEVLEVTAAAVRQTDWWKNERRRLRG
jgi:hypothetical protein